MKKIAIVWIICVLALVGLFAWLGADKNAQSGTQTEQQALIKAEFTLVRPDGKTVTNADFKGKYLLVFFGFTHCPDVCPTTLLLMQNVLGKLGQKADKLQPIFITVDPERDTPKIMGEYTSHFGTKILGLTGSAAQIKEVADNFKVYYSRINMPDPADGYMMDHSAFIFLMGPDGNYIAHFSKDMPEQALKDALAGYLR